MEIKEVSHALQCDNCHQASSPSEFNPSEARRIAMLRGWVRSNNKDWCVECFYRLDEDIRHKMLMNNELQD